MVLTREQAAAWAERWRTLGDAAASDAGDRSAAARLRTLDRLRAFALAAGRGRDAADDDIVRERFQTLREKLARGRRP